MRFINEIIVHCSATDPSWMSQHSVEEKRDEIRRWHRRRGWRDIGYAIIIDRDGALADGRDLNDDGDTFDDIGAHVRGRNTRSIGLCLVGGKGSNERDVFAEHFTAAQDHALRSLIADLRNRFPTIAVVSGHNQYAAKACPGFQVPVWMADQPAHLPDPVSPYVGAHAKLIDAVKLIEDAKTLIRSA